MSDIGYARVAVAVAVLKGEHDARAVCVVGKAAEEFSRPDQGILWGHLGADTTRCGPEGGGAEGPGRFDGGDGDRILVLAHT